MTASGSRSIALEKLRVLVVEDEAMVALLTEDMLSDLGCTVYRSAASLQEALEAVAQGGFDVALLDVNLRGEKVFPVADRLRALGCPFVFTTGYGADGLRADLRTHVTIAKPFSANELEEAIRLVMTETGFR